MTDPDTTLTQFAQSYRMDAAAVLVQIAKDEEAPAHARAQAAKEILAYSDGRPGASKPITVADFDQMTPEQLHEMFHQLLRYLTQYYPGLVSQWFDAYADVSQRLGLPKPNRFTRGTPQPRPAHVPVPPIARNPDPHPAIARARMREEQVLEPIKLPEPPMPEPVEPTPPDNVLPFGMRFENPILGNNPVSDNAPAPSGGVHPSVLARSESKNPLAFDSRFYNGHQYPWRRS
jgi:hypothetical protein